MDQLWTIVGFFLFSMMIGYSALRLCKIRQNTDIIESLVMSTGIGLAVFPFLAVLLNTLFIPLDVRILFVLALAYPAIDLVAYYRKKQKFSIKFPSKKDLIFYILLGLLFAWHLNLFLTGAFNYQYLEDGDPWHHANVIQYISEYKTYSVSTENFFPLFKYTEPYPPGFVTLMSMIQQVYPDTNWVLKFFNSLIISLSILFMYFFVKLYTGKQELGLFAAMIITFIPSYLSHFIFAAAYATAMFFPALYAMVKAEKTAYETAETGRNENPEKNEKQVKNKDAEKNNNDHKTEKSPKNKNLWWIIAALCYAGIFLLQPITAALFVALAGVYWAVTFLFKREYHKLLLKILVVGLLLSQLFWIPTFIKFDYSQIASKMPFGMLSGQVDDSSGGVVYSFSDYVFPKMNDKIDQAIGFGIVIFIMLALSLLFFILNFKKLSKNRMLLAFMIYGFFIFLGTKSNAFPYSFVPHRLWAYLAISVAMICMFGYEVIINSFKMHLLKNKIIIWSLLFILSGAVFYTSAPAKEAVQTAQWPSEILYESSPDYLWVIGNLPPKTPVWALCNYQFMNGLGMYTPIWNENLRYYHERKDALQNLTAEKIVEIAQKNKIKYVGLDSTCLRHMNETQVNQLGSDLVNNSKMKLIYNTETMYLFEVKT